jgi:hypothetical protein
MSAFALISPFVSVSTAWSAPATAPGTNSTIAGTLSGTTTDITPFTSSVSSEINFEELDSTDFAAGGWREKILGLGGATVQLTLNQSFAAANVDSYFGIGGTYGPTPGQSSPYYIEVRGTTSARAATNPGYCFAFFPTNVVVLSNGVGELATVSLQFAITGKPGRLTA